MLTRGAKSSEFVLNILAMVGIIILASLGKSDPEVTLSLLGLAGIYTGGRSAVKAAQGEHADE